MLSYLQVISDKLDWIQKCGDTDGLKELANMISQSPSSLERTRLFPKQIFIYHEQQAELEEK